MDKLPPEEDATAKQRARFKEWKEVEIKRIFCNDWASPDGIQAMWIHMNQQEMIFERALAGKAPLKGSTKGN